MRSIKKIFDRILPILLFTLLLAGALIYAREHTLAEQKKISIQETAEGARVFSEIPLHYGDLDAFLNMNIRPLLSYLDVDGTVQIVMDGLQKGRLNMNDCHSLMHLIGHHAALEHSDHLQSHITSANVNDCGGGFMHGVEDGLASGETRGFRDRLFSFCKEVKPISTEYIGCYHGAGHSFMKDTNDTAKALDLCSSLIADPEQGITSEQCYRGVFSESISVMERNGSDSTAQVDFCASQDDSLRELCAMELVGGLSPHSTPVDAEAALKSCTHQPSIEATCLKNMARAAADVLLATHETITPPRFIFSLEPASKIGYIHGTFDSIERMLHNNVHKPWQSFCSSFPSDTDRNSCRAEALKRLTTL